MSVHPLHAVEALRPRAEVGADPVPAINLRYLLAAREELGTDRALAIRRYGLSGELADWLAEATVEAIAAAAERAATWFELRARPEAGLLAGAAEPQDAILLALLGTGTDHGPDGRGRR